MNIKTISKHDKGYPLPPKNIASPPQQLNIYDADLVEKSIVIISCLALSVDAIAHRVAHYAGGLSIPVLPILVDHPYPSSNSQLAKRIVDNGGALVSEYSENIYLFKTNFVTRNRLVPGLAQAVLIT